MVDFANRRRTLLRQRLFRCLRRGDERGAERVRAELRRTCRTDDRNGVAVANSR